MRRAALAAFVALVALIAAPSSAVGENHIVQGKASTYGDGYEGLFALPRNLGGRGQHVRVCSVATRRCLERTSNDVGPVLSLHRVADLDATDFNYLCRCRWQQVGVITVTVEFLSRRVPAAPPTDIGDESGRFFTTNSLGWEVLGLGASEGSTGPLDAGPLVLDDVRRLRCTGSTPGDGYCLDAGTATTSTKAGESSILWSRRLWWRMVN